MKVFKNLLGLLWVIVVFIAITPVFAQDGGDASLSPEVGLLYVIIVVLLVGFVWLARNLRQSIPPEIAEQIHQSVPAEVMDNITDKIASGFSDLARSFLVEFREYAESTATPYDNILADVIESAGDEILVVHGDEGGELSTK